jgi:single-strand DNA-binding protein
MSLEVNTFVVAGNLGRDAEVTEGGNQPRVVFPIANNRSFRQNGEKVTKTSWFRCVWYGDAAVALAPYLTKGKGVHVVGRVEIREYEQDGQKKSITEVIVGSLQLLRDGSDSNGTTSTASNNADDFEDDEEVPF